MGGWWFYMQGESTGYWRGAFDMKHHLDDPNWWPSQARETDERGVHARRNDQAPRLDSVVVDHCTPAASPICISHHFRSTIAVSVADRRDIDDLPDRRPR